MFCPALSGWHWQMMRGLFFTVRSMWRAFPWMWSVESVKWNKYAKNTSMYEEMSPKNALRTKETNIAFVICNWWNSCILSDMILRSFKRHIIWLPDNAKLDLTVFCLSYSGLYTLWEVNFAVGTYGFRSIVFTLLTLCGKFDQNAKPT